MSILSNPKHERFAQLVAQGKTQSCAYIDAGYSKNGARQNAHRMITNDDISKRVHELQINAAKNCEITIETLLNELEIARKGANWNHQYYAAVQASIAKAKLLGFL